MTDLARTLWSMERTRWRASALVLGLALASVAAACSGDDTAVPEAASGEAPGAVMATDAPTTSANTTANTSAGASSDPSPTTAGPAPTSEPPLSPVEDPFFDPGDVPAGEAGDIIRARPFDVGDPNMQGWQVLAWSRDVRDEPVAVSGVVVAPTTPATGPRPVLSWAHGTTGMGDQCAPSRSWAAGNAPERALLPAMQLSGWVLAATDYQGLGTPGDHTYVVGQAEGRNVLDIVRAAQRLDGTGANAESPVVVWGHSQGGGAALFAAELAPTYAPELQVVGAVAGAPAAEFGTLQSTLDAGPYAGFQVMASIGFLAAYPELRSTEPLSADAQALVDQVRTSCVGDILGMFAGRSTADLVGPGTGSEQAVAAVLDENTAGCAATDVPILVYHGEDDDLIPPTVSARVLDRYCALGVPIQRLTYPGADHVSVINAALGDVIGFAQARLAGEPAPSSCG